MGNRVKIKGQRESILRGMDIDEKTKKQNEIMEAKADKAKAEYILEMLNDEEIAVQVTVCGVDLFLCVHDEMKQAVKDHIHEIDKFLNGKENKWE